MARFIPSATYGSRTDTAVMLVGTAREFGIGQSQIKSSHGGFYISDALDEVLSSESKQVSGNETTKTSGNRAAKKNSQKGN